MDVPSKKKRRGPYAKTGRKSKELQNPEADRVFDDDDDDIESVKSENYLDLAGPCAAETTVYTAWNRRTRRREYAYSLPLGLPSPTNSDMQDKNETFQFDAKVTASCSNVCDKQERSFNSCASDPQQKGEIGDENIELSISDVEKTSDDESELELEETDIFFNLSDSESDEGNDYEQNQRDSDNEPIYPGAKTSIGTFMLLLAIFCCKHNITGDGIQQLLQIIAFVLPENHILCTSLHAYKQFFKNLKNPLIYHYYCHHCLGPIHDISVESCPNEVCKKPFSKQHYFLEIPVVSQLKTLFSQGGFYDLLQHRFNRNNKDDYYEDIYDGNLYKSYVRNGGPLSKGENISFTFNTDGASVFKSSNYSIWPIYLVINELPYQERMKKENTILAALWFGSQKPSMSTFLKPFLDSMQRLSDGVELFAPRIGNFVCKAFLLCCTADLPARSLLCNCNQYNGAFSCWKCLQEGNTAKRGKGHSRVFPYLQDTPKGPIRTPESIVNDAREAVNQSKTQNGIKGPSWLLFFPEFHIGKGICIDYMHGILLGVQKLLIRLWFSAEFSKCSFSISKSVCVVDERLQKLQPTLDISRLPRSILKDLKYWKASEFRSFLLFYGVVVLQDLLDDQHYSHYILLVNSMHILLKSGTTEERLCYAERLLFNFCENFKSLYDECYMTLNIHQLLHLADSVRELGPLYTNSCFSFEDTNGFLLKMIQGTQGIDNQIATGISFVQKLPELKSKCIKKESKEEELYNMINAPYTLKRGYKIDDGIYVLGSIKKKVITNEQFQALSIYYGEVPQIEELLCFKRIEINRMLIYSLDYKRMIKRDNSTILFRKQSNINIGVGRVLFFLQIPSKLNENENDHVAIVKIMNANNLNPDVNIIAVETTNELRTVPVNAILSSCMFLSLEKEEKHGFVCLFPNRLESD